MNRLSDLSASRLKHLLATGELELQVGPYCYQVRSNEPAIIEGLTTLYGDFSITINERFPDFHVALESRGTLNKIGRRKVDFYFDHRKPFNRINVHSAYAFLEWGMNWCVSVHANEYLKVHAAVLEKKGYAIVLPGLPGAGKSTLCAALTLSGWRLLSDEHALIEFNSARVVPLCRPISLKNDSIEIIQRFDSRAVIGPVSSQTHKGTVAHMKSDLCDNSHSIESVPVCWMIFPEYSPEAECKLKPKLKPESFMFAAMHSFNYSLLGELGFQTMGTLLDGVTCFDLTYAHLDQALSAIENLTQLG